MSDEKKDTEKPLFKHLGLVEVRALRDAVNEGLRVSEKNGEVIAHIDPGHLLIVVDIIVERRVRESARVAVVGASPDRRPH